MACDQFFLQYLVTIVQNYSKYSPSLLLVLWLMNTECSNYNISSSLMRSPDSLARCFSQSQLMQSSLSVSKWLNTVLRPYFVFMSPTLGVTSYTNSSNVMGLFLTLRPQMMLQMRVPFLPSPSSSMILLISSGSIVPEWSWSKRSKVFLSCSYSQGCSLSFQVRAALVLAVVLRAEVVLAGLAVRLISLVEIKQMYMILLSQQIRFIDESGDAVQFKQKIEDFALMAGHTLYVRLEITQALEDTEQSEIMHHCRF